MSMLVWAVLIIAFACAVGGATGFGGALIATPLMLLAGFDVVDVVVINIAVGLVTRLAAAVQLREHMTWRHVAWLGGASLPGAWLGVVTVSMLPMAILKPSVGVLTVLCGLSLAIQPKGGPRPPSTPALATAGFTSGYLGTTTSLSGPPLVLVLGRAKLPPLSFIADLAGFFVISGVMSLALLFAYSPVELDTLWPTLLACLAAGLVANWVGIAIAKRLTPGVFRWAVIALVVAAGITAIVA